MKVFILILTLSALVVEVDSEIYLNKFAVHIEGGSGVAHMVASEHGFINLGQVRKET